jgi:hypothetical protein
LLIVDQALGHLGFFSKILPFHLLPPFERVGCCWPWKRGFGASQGQSWGQSLELIASLATHDRGER